MCIFSIWFEEIRIFTLEFSYSIKKNSIRKNAIINVRQENKKNENMSK